MEDRIALIWKLWKHGRSEKSQAVNSCDLNNYPKRNSEVSPLLENLPFLW